MGTARGCEHRLYVPPPPCLGAGGSRGRQRVLSLLQHRAEQKLLFFRLMKNQGRGRVLQEGRGVPGGDGMAGCWAGRGELLSLQ